MDILLAEDADDQRMVIATALRNQGYQVIETIDGEQSLELLKTNKDIRIVLSDWMMPKVDGIELCNYIRHFISDRYIYFIILSGRTDQKAIVEGMNQGADDFLYKPINFDELKARLHAADRIISLKKRLEKKIHIIEEDLKVAADTQLQMISKPARLNNVDLTWFFKPSMFLGGDMLGYHLLDKDTICFYQLDVSGHGIPSSLFSVQLNNVLSGFQSNTDLLMEKNNKLSCYIPKLPSEVLKTLNKRFQSNSIDMLYFTMVYGFIDTKTGKLCLSQAGHPHPIMISHQQNDTTIINGNGIPIGLALNAEYQDSTITLKPKDKLFIYSDGLPDCNQKNNKKNYFGNNRLMKILNNTSKLNIHQIKSKIEQEIFSWHGDKPFNDDVTFLVLEWNP